MATPKTFKLEPETMSRLQAISEGLGMTWDETFSTLSSLYEQNYASSEQGRAAETKQFQALLQKVSDAYTAALAYNGTAEDRIRHEYAARIETSEQAVSSLKDQLADAVEAKEKAEAHASELDGKLKDQTDELNAVKKEYEEYKADAEAQAKQDAVAFYEQKKLNGLLQDQIANLSEQLDGMKDKAASADSVRAELARLRDEAKQSAAALDEARKEIETLKVVSSEEQRAAKAREQELRQRYEERAENARQAAENKLRAAVIAEREAGVAKVQERIDKMQAQIDKATARADAWQEKYYALKEKN